MDSAASATRTLLASMLFQQLLRPFAREMGAAGGYAADCFAQTLAATLEKRDG